MDGRIRSSGQRVRQEISKRDAVIFDLDGTLVDSMWMWKAIDMEYLGRHGHEYPPLLQKNIEGMSFSETAVYFKREFKIEDSLEKIKETWVEMSIEKYRTEVPLKDGAGRLLEFLKESGIPAGIATSNGREMVDAVLDSLGIRKYFQVIATACEVAAGKPAPDIYLHTLQELAVAPQECIAIEDSEKGIASAKEAGLEVWAMRDEHFGMDQSQADAFLTQLSDICKKISENRIDESSESTPS